MASTWAMRISVSLLNTFDEKVPPALSVVLVVVGAGLIIAGRKA